MKTLFRVKPCCPVFEEIPFSFFALITPPSLIPPPPRHHIQENDDIVRKSVAHVWINRGLTPMRAFVNQVTPDIEEACRTRENYRKDADSYRRRYLAAEKKSMSAPTPEKQAEANQEQAKLKVKLENANTLYETQNTLVKAELEKAKIARDEAIEMMVITVAACQMELFEQCYKRLVTACADFPADKMKQVRASIQNEMRAGGPNLGGGPKGLSHQVGKAANIVSGKKGMNDYKREKEEKAVRDQAALDRARQVAMEDERRRAAGLSGPPSPPTRGGVSKGPPLPPKRFSNPTVQPPSVTSFAPKAKAPPPVPVRGGGGSSSPKAKVPPPVPVRGGGGGGGGVASRAAAFNRPPAIPSQRPPALPKKSAPPPPPKRASAAPTCRALFDNVPDDSDELAFKVGDIITIIKKDDSGWWEGTIRGKKGIFPSNFVKEI